MTRERADGLIMETCSKIKRGRGRPKKYAEIAYQQLAAAGSVKTPRGKQNYITAAIAVKTLSGFQTAHGSTIFSYLLTPPRKTMLAALGRMNTGMEGDKHRMISAAKAVCREQMKTANAVGYIRRLRGIVKPHSWDLLREIKETIKKYCDCHENTSPDEIERALRVAALPYKNNLQGNLGLFATDDTHPPPPQSGDGLEAQQISSILKKLFR